LAEFCILVNSFLSRTVGGTVHSVTFKVILAIEHSFIIFTPRTMPNAQQRQWKSIAGWHQYSGVGRISGSEGINRKGLARPEGSQPKARRTEAGWGSWKGVAPAGCLIVLLYYSAEDVFSCYISEFIFNVNSRRRRETLRMRRKVERY